MPVLCGLLLNFYVYQLLLENKNKAPILYLGPFYLKYGARISDISRFSGPPKPNESESGFYQESQVISVHIKVWEALIWSGVYSSTDVKFYYDTS